MTSTTPPARADRPRIQDLAGAVLAGSETEDLLDLLLHSARTDLVARSAALVMPLSPGAWAVEMVEGPDAAALLGEEIPAESSVGLALHRADADALEAIGTLEVGQESCRALVAVVDAAEHGSGLLTVLRAEDSPAFTEADRERLDSLAGLVTLTLRVPTLRSSSEIDDERGRIARDLHDLAIQELFAVGMEL
ncbi:MAG: histidine kinase, partial [Brachybacterium sp.]